MLQGGSSFVCKACHGSTGGCLDILGRFDQEQGGSATFQAGRAVEYGGALAVKTGVMLGGNIIFRGGTCGSDQFVESRGKGPMHTRPSL